MTSRLKDVADLRLWNKVLPSHGRTASVNVSGKENSLPHQLCSHLSSTSEFNAERACFGKLFSRGDLWYWSRLGWGGREERRQKKIKLYWRIYLLTFIYEDTSILQSKKKIQTGRNSTLQWCWGSVQAAGRGVKRYNTMAISTCRNIIGHKDMRYQRVSTSPYGKQLWD